MAGEITETHPAREIGILGVNADGEESGNAQVCVGRTLPWLQDTLSVNVWSKWHVAYRDVILLDEQNQRVAVYNLTEHNLARPAAYDSLKTLLIELSQAD